MKRATLLILIFLILLLLFGSGCTKNAKVACLMMCAEHNMSFESVSGGIKFGTGDNIVICTCSRAIEVIADEKKD